MTKVLKIKNIDLGYRLTKKKQKILKSNINLSAAKGELVAIIGRNGSGKSTLLRTIINQIAPIYGKIFYFTDDKPIEIADFHSNEFARKISFVDTKYINIPNLTVFDLVSTGRYPYTNWLGKLSNDDKKLILGSLKNVGLDGFENKFVSEISDGERQRVMIARTLAQNTDIIILDEPTAFLDLPNKYELVKLMKTLTDKKQKTILFSTHDLTIATQYADKIWLFLDDEIKEGAPEDLILGDELSKIFRDSNLIFDKNIGDFKPMQASKHKVMLKGEGHYFFWTKKALQRAGFEIDESETIITVNQSDCSFYWTINSQKEAFNSIYALINALKK